MQLIGNGKDCEVLIVAIESVLFSDKIKKINMYEWAQERIIIITSEKVYNIKHNKIKRTILISKIGGISYNLLGSK